MHFSLCKVAFVKEDEIKEYMYQKKRKKENLGARIGKSKKEGKGK